MSRNFFGAQVRSFEMAVDGPPGYNDAPYNAVFIRAPAIISVGEEIQVLTRIQNATPADGSDPQDVIIAARKVRTSGVIGSTDQYMAAHLDSPVCNLRRRTFWSRPSIPS